MNCLRETPTSCPSASVLSQKSSWKKELLQRVDRPEPPAILRALSSERRFSATSRTLTGPETRLYLKVFPRTFVVAGNSLKIRTGNLCGDSRHLPLVQLMMSYQTTSWSFVNKCEFGISIASVTKCY